MTHPIRILFVCLGNICRSPSAEGVFRKLLIHAGLESRVEIDSAGIGAWHIGKAPDPRAQKAAQQRGCDISKLKARQVQNTDFETFDMVLAMDEDNLFDLRQHAPTHHHHKITLLLDYGPGTRSQSVPDPYYGGEEGFEHMMDLIEQAAEGLLKQLKEKHLR